MTNIDPTDEQRLALTKLLNDFIDPADGSTAALDEAITDVLEWHKIEQDRAVLKVRLDELSNVFSGMNNDLRNQVRHLLGACIYVPPGSECRHIICSKEDENDVKVVTSFILDDRSRLLDEVESELANTPGRINLIEGQSLVSKEDIRKAIQGVRKKEGIESDG